MPETCKINCLPVYRFYLNVAAQHTINQFLFSISRALNAGVISYASDFITNRWRDVYIFYIDREGAVGLVIVDPPDFARFSARVPVARGAQRSRIPRALFANVARAISRERTDNKRDAYHFESPRRDCVDSMERESENMRPPPGGLPLTEFFIALI